MKQLNLHPVKSQKHLTIKASVPPQLIGTTYLRNGSNAYLQNVKNHIFDGDGMIHCLQFHADKIVYHNRWIKTFRYTLERKYKKPLFVRLASLNTIEIFSKFFQKMLLLEDVTNHRGDGTANTNIIYHHNKLLALNEMDHPYELKISNGKLHTKGRYDFAGKLTHNINAHPKIDPLTNELITLGYDIFKQMCFVSFVHKSGTLVKTVSVPLQSPTIIHDVGITKNYVIILDLALQFNLSNVLFSTFPMGVNHNHTSKILLLHRYSNLVSSFQLPQNEVVFHIANSWEENNCIIMYAFSYNINNLDLINLHSQKPVLKKFVIHIPTTSVSIFIVSKTAGEYPVVDQSMVGLPTQFIYYSRISDNGFDGIVSHHVTSAKESFVPFPPNMYGGECALFQNLLLNVAYNTVTKKSHLLVYKQDSLKLISNVPLQCRIPFGFHGNVFCI